MSDLVERDEMMCEINFTEVTGEPFTHEHLFSLRYQASDIEELGRLQPKVEKFRRIHEVSKPLIAATSEPIISIVFYEYLLNEEWDEEDIKEALVLCILKGDFSPLKETELWKEHLDEYASRFPK